mgnify:FL=1|tara:strand:- start:262 stop:528 length:267 start_codon:yes stop_codon:yes gene_type:complete
MGKTATTVSASLAYTASAGDTITKIYAPAAATLASVEFGQNQNPYNVNAITSRVATIAIPAGTYLEGPIVQFKNNDPSNIVLVYLDQK